MTVLRTNSRDSKKKKTLLGYTLSSHQDAVVNYLIPSISACVLYKLIIAFDIGVIFRHYKDKDPFWASFTLFFMYLPALTSYIIIVTNSKYWVEPSNWRDRDNWKWFFFKFVQHLLFPVWMMWRFAERIFWSVEAAISTDETSIEAAKDTINSPRSVELYVFLQAYLHALPQILCQLHILMRHNANIDQTTKNVQVLAIILNLSKLAITTTYYQRFKAQKVLGYQYPWHKIRIKDELQSDTNEHQVVLRSSLASQNRSIIEKRKSESFRLLNQYHLEPSTVEERRRSSDIYLEPELTLKEDDDAIQNIDESSDVEADLDRVDDGVTETQKRVRISHYDEIDDMHFGKMEECKNEETSRIQSWRKSLSKQLSLKEIRKSHPISNNSSEPDFNISRVIYIKGLEEDDLSGKLVAFCWWFTFVLGRVLSISAFVYFFKNQAAWLLAGHYILVMAIFFYDIRYDTIERKILKIFFYIFLCFVYLFVIIEFKIKFKRAYFIYYGFFFLVFFENMAMCLIWYYSELETILNDYWFRYTFYMIITCGLLSLSTMTFYLILTKPKSLLIPTGPVNYRNSN